LYPILQGFRLTSSGWEIANRSSEFLFWAIAFVLTIGLLSLRGLPMLRPIWKLVFVVCATIIFLGGTISGWPPWARLPGSYLVSADTRSIEPEGISAAKWAGDYLSPNSRIGTDRINTLLLAVYGNLRPVTHLADGTYLSSVFFAPVIGNSERDLMDRVDLKYLLVDKRMSTGLPLVGVYFEGGELNANAYTEPIPLSALEKFSRTPDVSEIFNDGNISIYDVSELHANP
jgi:hypothetical protein